MDKHFIQARWQSFTQRIKQANVAANYQKDNRNRLLVVGMLLCVFGAMYLWQTNSLATKGYKINELDTKASALKDENKRLQVEITELRSTSRLEQKVADLKMVSVARVEYLQANGTSVALNR